MTSNHKQKLRTILSWVTACLVLITAAALIISCVQIYQSGSRPFTREAIAHYAGKLALIGCLCLATVLAGLFLPQKQENWKAIRDDRVLLKRYNSQIPAAVKEQRLRRTCIIITGIVMLILAVYPCVYFCDLSNFTIADLSADILKAVLVAMIPGAVALAVVYVCSLICQRSISREIAIYKDHGVKPEGIKKQANTDRKIIIAIRSVVLAAAIVFLVLGALNGGAADVLGKAIRICTECIGLG